MHLFGQFLVNNDSSPRKGSLLKKLWPFIKDKWPRESDLKSVSTLNPEQPSILTPKIWRLKENYEISAGGVKYYFFACGATNTDLSTRSFE